MHVNDYMPLDIQRDILKRLPIKSLMKVRSVSKPLKSIIESSEFIAVYNIHTHRYNHQKLLIGLYNSSHAYTFDDDDDNTSPDQHNFRLIPSLTIHKPFNDMMVGYSQGLFAVYRLDEYYREVVVIWNPSIRNAVDIPLSGRFKCPNYDSFIGFGVCNATDPTIVKVASPALNASKSKKFMQVEIFKLSTGKWRLLSDCCLRDSLEFRQKVVATDRFIHWLVRDGAKLKIRILSFDMMSEKFIEVSFHPRSILAYKRCDDLDLSKLSCRESFAVLETTHENDKRYNVWIMEHGGDRFMIQKLVTINNPKDLIKRRVVGFRKNDQPIIHTRNPFKDNEHNIFVYKPGYSGLFKPIGINHGNNYPCFAGSYMETLLLLDH
uniref:putative F-box protein At1g26515 n=1 Tax=Erigeron canadensis TaxID=72917 RepID=UPI001CB894A4|nr:putative F-box protein At1g26515 [Erigeron canadensis]